jgi:hypothetical protein
MATDGTTKLVQTGCPCGAQVARIVEDEKGIRLIVLLSLYAYVMHEGCTAYVQPHGIHVYFV